MDVTYYLISEGFGLLLMLWDQPWYIYRAMRTTAWNQCMARHHAMLWEHKKTVHCPQNQCIQFDSHLIASHHRDYHNALLGVGSRQLCIPWWHVSENAHKIYGRG